jgi:hypothetical protein
MPQEAPKPAPSAPSPSVPQKPAFPQNREVREGAYGQKTEIK